MKNKFDVLGVTEMYLCEGISDKELKVDYMFVRWDTINGGGGAIGC